MHPRWAIGLAAPFIHGAAQWAALIGWFGGGNGFWQNFKEWHIGTNFGPATIMAGHSIAAYVRELRVDYASRQLSGSKESLAAIAQAAGFSD